MDQVTNVLVLWSLAEIHFEECLVTMPHENGSCVLKHCSKAVKCQRGRGLIIWPAGSQSLLLRITPADLPISIDQQNEKLWDFQSGAYVLFHMTPGRDWGKHPGLVPGSLWKPPEGEG